MIKFITARYAAVTVYVQPAILIKAQNPSQIGAAGWNGGLTIFVNKLRQIVF